MDSFKNNIKKYSEFNMDEDSQKIGLFVVGHEDYQSPTYIRLLSGFNLLSSKFSSCIIDVNKTTELQLVKNDLLNDNFLLDIVVIERDAFHSNEFVELLIEKCKLLGIKIIYEIDDDLVNIDESHRDYEYYFNKRNGIFFIIKNADYVTVSTNALKSKLLNLNDNIIVIPNVLTHYWDVDFESITHDENIIKIGYMGTPTHKDDIKILKQAILNVKEYFKEKNIEIIFEMVGGTPDELDWAKQIEIPKNDKVYPNFVKFLKFNVDWDIALAPLENNNINLSKSELKYLEYTALGVPGIYSNIGPYKENIVHEFNGLLVDDNSPKSWEENIIRLIEDKILRNNIKLNAINDISTNYYEHKSIKMWESVLNDCIRDKKSLLYKYFMKYVDIQPNVSFIEFLKKRSSIIIKESGLFDENDYLSRYPDVKKEYTKPIVHYLELWEYENCKPSNKFDNYEYLNRFPYIQLNPFVHFILYNNLSISPFVPFKYNIECTDFKKNFDILKNSSLFIDSDYLEMNIDVAKSNMGALDHWIKHGYKSEELFRNPNKYFSKNYYINKYLYNGEENWNSLTHFVEVGNKKRYKQNIFDMIYRDYNNDQINNISMALSSNITIIIPIFDIFDEFKEYLHSWIFNTNVSFNLIFLVKKHFKFELSKLLESYPVNYRFIEINDFSDIPFAIDFELSNLSNDIVILNSYSMVTPRWLEKLIIRAYSDENCDMISPISSVTKNLSKIIDDYMDVYGFDVDDIARIFQKSTDFNKIFLNYFDGACILIKRSFVNHINFSDFKVTFNQDESLGINLGLADCNYLLDDSTFIYFNGKFFDNYKDFLLDVSEVSLNCLNIKKFLNSYEFNNIITNFIDAIKYIDETTLSKRVLIVSEGDDELFLEKILNFYSKNNFDFYILKIYQNSLKLFKQDYLLKSWETKRDLDIFNIEFLNIYFNVIDSLNIEMINLVDLPYSSLNLNSFVNLLNVHFVINCNNIHSACPYSGFDYLCNNECKSIFNCPYGYSNNQLNDSVINLFNDANLILINEQFKSEYSDLTSKLNEDDVKYISSNYFDMDDFWNCNFGADLEIIFNKNIIDLSQNISHDVILSDVEYNNIYNSDNLFSLDNFSVSDMIGSINQISIVIPIFNAYEDTKKCIESVFENTSIPFNLILINDNSTDERIKPLIDGYSMFNNVTIIHNKINNGFTKNVNVGIKAAGNDDVVLLNSDTIVSRYWLQKIIFLAYSQKDIGTITPFSNASDISIPVTWEGNSPSLNDVNNMGLFLSNLYPNYKLVAPTGNGYCLFIKRKTILDVGLFDEKSFDKGYGEETDFTMRAKKRGWKNCRTPSIFIYHKKSASFSLDKSKDLKKEHKKIILSKHPSVFKEWGVFSESKDLLNVLRNIDDCIENMDSNLLKKNILFITSIKKGIPFIEDYTLFEDRFNFYCLTFDDNNVRVWYSQNESNFDIVEELNLEDNLSIGVLNQFYVNLILNYNIFDLFVNYTLMGSEIFLKLVPLNVFNKLGLSINYVRPKYLIDYEIDDYGVNNYNNIDFKNNRCVVYTAITGGYDDLIDPDYVDPDFDYVCFTDNPNLESNVWDIRLINSDEPNKTKLARKYKLLPHRYLNEYDYSFWIDGAFNIIGDLKNYVKKYLKESPMIAIKHSERKCIYDESAVCIKLGKDDEQAILNQINQYESIGYPKNHGLIESGFLFRKHNDESLKRVMEDWYYELNKNSVRDQLSFNFVAWKNNFEYDIATIMIRKNQYVEHKNKHNA